MPTHLQLQENCNHIQKDYTFMFEAVALYKTPSFILYIHIHVYVCFLPPAGAAPHLHGHTHTQHVGLSTGLRPAG